MRGRCRTYVSGGRVNLGSIMCRRWGWENSTNEEDEIPYTKKIILQIEVIHITALFKIPCISYLSLVNRSLSMLLRYN